MKTKVNHDSVNNVKPDTSTKIEFENEDEQKIIMSRPSTSNKSHKEIKDADGKISLNQLDTFFMAKKHLMI